MTIQHLVSGVVSLSFPNGWNDITDTLESASSPVTFVDSENGFGALQFSPAIYKSGVIPEIRLNDLRQLLVEFAASRQLESPFNRQEYFDSVLVLGESFRKKDDFIRVWYCTNGKSLVLVTYICEWIYREAEKDVIEDIIQSIHFKDS